MEYFWARTARLKFTSHKCPWLVTRYIWGGIISLSLSLTFALGQWFRSCFRSCRGTFPRCRCRGTFPRYRWRGTRRSLSGRWWGRFACAGGTGILHLSNDPQSDVQLVLKFLHSGAILHTNESQLVMLFNNRSNIQQQVKYQKHMHISISYVSFFEVCFANFKASKNLGVS